MRPLFRTCKDASRMVRVIGKLPDSIKLVSFDVFDTLLQRCLMDPDWTKIPAAREVVSILAERNIPVSVGDALQRRLSVEQSLRDAARTGGFDHEFHIEDLPVPWLETYLKKDLACANADRLIRVELENERNVLEPVPGILEAVIAARRKVPKVIFISDMYLGFAHILDFLNLKGYSGLFSGGYVSSEHKLAKGTGRLYRLMLENEGVSEDQWVHFGDNEWSDFSVPRRLGGAAYLFSREEHRQKVVRSSSLKRLCRVSEQWAGAEFVEVCVQRGNAGGQDSLPKEIGFAVLGPAFANYVHRVVERVRDEEIDLVLFPARDGFLLNEIFRRIWSKLVPNRETPGVYTFLSRKAVYLASLNEIGPREILHGLGSREPSLRTMLTRFSLDPEHFRDLAERCGISLDFPLWDRFGNYSLFSFLRHPEFLKKVRSAQRSHRELVRDYLSQLGFWKADRVALVDLGWGGTTQDALTCAFFQEPDWPRLFGFYLGFIRWLPVFSTPVSTYEGIFYDTGRDPTGTGPFCQFLEIFELAARAPHPTTVWFERKEPDGLVLPVFVADSSEGRRKEVRDQPLVLALQKGILEFLDVYMEMIPFMQHPPSSYTPFILGQLDRFIRFPREKEAQAFMNFYHQEDFGVEIVMQEVYEKLNWRTLSGWKQFAAAYQWALWRQGLSAASRFPGMVTACNIMSTNSPRLF